MRQLVGPLKRRREEGQNAAEQQTEDENKAVRKPVVSHGWHVPELAKGVVAVRTTPFASSGTCHAAMNILGYFCAASFKATRYGTGSLPKAFSTVPPAVKT